METDDLLTVPEVSAELGVTRGAIQNAMAEGRLPHVVKYGRKLISRADLEAYKQRTRPEGEKPKGRPRRIMSYRVSLLNGAHIATVLAADDGKARQAVYDRLESEVNLSGIIRDLNEDNLEVYRRIIEGEKHNTLGQRHDVFDPLKTEEIKP